MKTQAYPVKEIAPNTYEIGEFDCASNFLLVGDEKAMLIDTGIDIGDLKGFIGTLTNKPLMVCYTHDHADHIGGASAFDHAYVHPKEIDFGNRNDFRPLGEPLGEDVLRDAITACEQFVAGTAKAKLRPAFLPTLPPKPVVTIGRTNISYFADGIREE